MKYVINSDECEKVGIRLPTFLYLLSIYSNQFITESCPYDASNRSLLTFKGKDCYGNPISPELTEYGKDIIKTILKNSENNMPSPEEITTLASTLRDIYPEGKKPGTPYNWKGSQRDIEIKLGKFFLIYGRNYTKDQIINATREYVEAFKGDYKFMRLLKYFIWKKEDGIESSDLADYIDNAGQENVSNNSDWINELI
jgi:hypothetical protein